MRRHLDKGWFMAAGLALLMYGCGGDGSSDTGTVKLSITDAPVDAAAGVVLTVESATLEGVQGRSTRAPSRSMSSST